MDPLPTELLELIAEHLDFDGLKSLRLTSWQCCSVATYRVFHHVHVGLFRFSLERLERIASSSLAKHVKKLTFHADMLPQWGRSEWQSHTSLIGPVGDTGHCLAAAHNDPQSGQGTTASSREVEVLENRSDQDTIVLGGRHQVREVGSDEFYRRYAQLRREQLRWKLGSEEVLMFEEFFGRLPNIEHVEFANLFVSCPRDKNSSHIPLWRTLRRETLVSPQALLSTDSRSNAQDLSQSATIWLTALITLLRAMEFRASFSGVNPIKRLHIQSFPLGWTNLSFMEEDHQCWVDLHIQQRRLLEGLGKITHLSITIPEALKTSLLDFRYYSVGTGSWVPLMHSAANLRSLELSYTPATTLWQRDHHALDIYYLFNGVFMKQPQIAITWPRLEEFKLSTHVIGGALLEFLTRHASTLRSLCLSDTLVVSDFGEVIRKIPQIVTLREFAVKHVHSTTEVPAGKYTCFFPRGLDPASDADNQLLAYVLGKAEEMPDLQDCSRSCPDLVEQNYRSNRS